MTRNGEHSHGGCNQGGPKLSMFQTRSGLTSRTWLEKLCKRPPKSHHSVRWDQKNKQPLKSRNPQNFDVDPDPAELEWGGKKEWRPYGDSNPGYRRERAVS